MSDYDLVKPVIEHLPLAVIVVNNKREVLLANKIAQDMSKKTEDELIGLKGGQALGCKFSTITQECGTADQCRMCKIKTSVLKTFEDKESINLPDITMEFTDLGTRNLRVAISYLNLDQVNRNIEGERRISPGRRQSDLNKEIAIVAMEDITEFKKREKLDAAMEIVGAICHEMNQPLQSLLGYSGLLEMPNDDNDKIRNMARHMGEQVTRIGTLTKKLMSLKTYKTKPYLKNNILDIDESSK